MPPLQMLSLIGKVAGSVLSPLIPPAKRWWKRFAFPAASTKRMSVLVARVAGDNSAHSNQDNIREAIRAALPEVEVHIWHEEWQLPDGEDRAAQTAAYKTARSWLETKKCDLLIVGRMKSEGVVSLRFIPAIGASSSDDPTTRPLTYALAADTMDLPAKFANDVASSLGASVIVHLKTHRASSEVLRALIRLTAQLQTVVEGSPALSDVRIRASLINSYSIARAFIFEFSGNLEDLRVAMSGFHRACGTLNPQGYPLEWSQSRSNYGAALARLASVTNDSEKLLQAIAVMKEAVPGLSSDVVRWGKVQLFLASAYLEMARVQGSMEDLTASLDVCLQLINQELREKEPGLWAAAQDQYGRGLARLADTQAGSEALFRSVQAFTDALEVWSGTNPEMQAVALVNLSGTFIALGSRQGSLDWFNDTIMRLREAQSLVSKRHHLRLWLAIQINLGICLSLAAEVDHTKYKEAVSILRHAQPLVPKFDIQLSSRLSLALAKALMFSGWQSQMASEIKESISIFEELLKIGDPALQRETKNNLGMAYYLLGVTSEDVQCLEIARDILSDLIQHAAATFPFIRAQSQQGLGRTLREIGRIERSTSIVRASIEHFEEGLTFASEATAPVFLAGVHMDLASSYLELARLDKATNSLELAQEHISEALSVLGPNTRGGLTTEVLKIAEAIREFGDDNDPITPSPTTGRY
jgi:tetratricopeptide (TPR) repeat protein